MGPAFDPYLAWLGIPPSEQPPQHYRLLGLPVFESNRDAIAQSVAARQAHVRSFLHTPQAELAQKLLFELTAAKLVLLDLDRKAQYDARLRAQHPAQVAAANPAANPAVVPAPGPAAVPATRQVLMPPPPRISLAAIPQVVTLPGGMPLPPPTALPAGAPPLPARGMPLPPAVNLPAGAPQLPPRCTPLDPEPAGLVPAAPSAPTAVPTEAAAPVYRALPAASEPAPATKQKLNPILQTGLALIGGVLAYYGAYYGSKWLVSSALSPQPRQVAQQPAAPPPPPVRKESLARRIDPTQPYPSLPATPPSPRRTTPKVTPPSEPIRQPDPPAVARTVPEKAVPLEPARVDPATLVDMREFRLKANRLTSPFDADEYSIKGLAQVLKDGNWWDAFDDLSRGSHLDWRRLARQESVARPFSATENLALGHAWWEQSERPPYPQQPFRDLAAWHYGLAMPHLPASEMKIVRERYESAREGSEWQHYLWAQSEPVFTNIVPPTANFPLRSNQIFCRNIWRPYGLQVLPQANSVARVSFPLNEFTGKLVGEFGLLDSSQRNPATPLTVKLLADGKFLNRGVPWTKMGQSASVQSQLTKVTNLEFEIECPGPNDGCELVISLQLQPGAGKIKWPPFARRPMAHLLPTINLSQAVVAGNWTLKNENLVVAAGIPYARVRLPMVEPLPKLYTIDAEFHVNSPLGVAFGILVQGRPMVVLFDQPGKRLGLETAAESGRNTLPADQTQLFKTGLNIAHISVSGNRVEVFLNNRMAGDWRLTEDQLQMDPAWSVGEQPALFVGSLGGEVRFTALGLKTISIALPPETKSPDAVQP